MMDANYVVIKELNTLIDDLQAENAELKRQLAEREGYVLVPLEPTNEMLDATTDIEAYRDDFGYKFGMSWGQSEAVYKAMIAASPKQGD